MLTSSITSIMLAAILILMSVVTFPITSLTAQLTTGSNNSTNATSILNTTKIFQSNIDGIRVQVPSGWVVVDNINNTELYANSSNEDLEYELLASLCPQSETLPKIAGGIVCSEVADEAVDIYRYSDLRSRPEFAVLERENKSVTTSDFLAYIIQKDKEELNITEHKLLKNIDRVVNVTDSQTNQTIATALAKYVELSYLNWEGERVDRDFELLVVSNDGNTGYFLIIDTRGSPEKLPSAQQQIFDSFELVK
jgi:hypothetical protein